MPGALTPPDAGEIGGCGVFRDEDRRLLHARPGVRRPRLGRHAVDVAPHASIRRVRINYRAVCDGNPLIVQGKALQALQALQALEESPRAPPRMAWRKAAGVLAGSFAIMRRHRPSSRAACVTAQPPAKRSTNTGADGINRNQRRTVALFDPLYGIPRFRGHFPPVPGPSGSVSRSFFDVTALPESSSGGPKSDSCAAIGHPTPCQLSYAGCSVSSHADTSLQSSVMGFSAPFSARGGSRRIGVYRDIACIILSMAAPSRRK